MVGTTSFFTCAVYVFIYFFFYDVFGETPVNFFNHGGGNGGSNLIFNLVVYGLLTIVLCGLPLVFLKHRKRRFVQVVTGCIFGALFMFLYTSLSLVMAIRE